MNRAVFLDRDNTLIHNDGDLGDPAQVRLIQGAASAVASLRGLGYRIVVISNQGGVARGKFSEADVEATNNRVNELIHANSGATIDRFYYCPFHPEGTVEKYKREHPWRKPQPGMILQAAKDLNLDLSQSWLVGDQLRDIEAGVAAGVRTVLLTPEATGAQPPLLQDRAAAEVLGKAGDAPGVMPSFVARTLIEAVRIIAQQRRPEGVEDWRGLVDTPPMPAEKPRSPASAAGGTARKPAPVSTPAGPPVTAKGPPSETTVAEPPAFAPSAAVAPSPPIAPALITSVEAPTPAPPPGDELPESPPVPLSPAEPPATPAATKQEPPPALVAQQPAPVASASGREAPGLGAASLTGVEQTLKQILQELRNHRRVGDEFSVVSMLAIVFQLIAAICLLAALWLGAGQDGLFLRWIGAAIMVQLIAITLLLFRK